MLCGRLCPRKSVRCVDVCVRRKMYAGWTFVSEEKCALGGRLCPRKSVRCVDVCVRGKVCAGWTFVSDVKCALGGRLCPTKSVRWVDVCVRGKVCAGEFLCLTKNDLLLILLSSKIILNDGD